jgi:hypothetical protein
LVSTLGTPSTAVRLHVSADNAWSENKNIWIFALMCLLVHFGWFMEIVIGMLPVGHTHDFDDAGLFGHIQPRIKSVTTTGLFDVIAQLKSIWSPLCLLLVVTESDSLSLTEHCWQVQASKAGQRSTCTDDTRRSHLRLDQQTSTMKGRLIPTLGCRTSDEWVQMRRSLRYKCETQMSRVFNHAKPPR